MQDHDITKGISDAVGHFLEYHSAYVIAFLSVTWAMTVWAFRSVIRKYDFASKEHVLSEIQKCKAEVDRRDDQLEEAIMRLNESNTKQHEAISEKQDHAIDLIIKHLDK